MPFVGIFGCWFGRVFICCPYLRSICSCCWCQANSIRVSPIFLVNHLFLIASRGLVAHRLLYARSPSVLAPSHHQSQFQSWHLSPGRWSSVVCLPSWAAFSACSLITWAFVCEFLAFSFVEAFTRPLCFTAADKLSLAVLFCIGFGIPPSISNPLLLWGYLRGSELLPQLILLDAFFSLYFTSFFLSSSCLHWMTLLVPVLGIPFRWSRALLVVIISPRWTTVYTFAFSFIFALR